MKLPSNPIPILHFVNTGGPRETEVWKWCTLELALRPFFLPFSIPNPLSWGIWIFEKPSLLYQSSISCDHYMVVFVPSRAFPDCHFFFLFSGHSLIFILFKVSKSQRDHQWKRKAFWCAFKCLTWMVRLDGVVLDLSWEALLCPLLCL